MHWSDHRRLFANLARSLQEIGTRGGRVGPAHDVKLHYYEHRKLGPTTGNVEVMHDGVDLVKKKWLGVFVHHIREGIGGMLPLQATLKRVR